jgi:uncharacterized membrane protein YphA (DoxX/SURF4 family)
MPEATGGNRHRVRATVSLVASILVGLTLLIAGSGKATGFGEMPGQTMQFIGAILPDAWLTPGVAYFIGDIFFPHIIPWAEILLGIFLLARLWPRIIAALCLPLTAAFMANNLWYISQGETRLASCECFGIWEEMFGTLTHVQSLSLDIGLFMLALAIIFVHPNGFLSAPSWWAKLKKKPSTKKINESRNKVN